MAKDRRFDLDEALLVAGQSAATNQFIADLEKMHIQACEANAALQDIDIDDVYNLGCTDDLVRLKRNAAALRTLLSMCNDAAVYIKAGIHTIFEARDAAEKEAARKQRELLIREEAYERKRKENAKRRKKPDETGEQ